MFLEAKQKLDYMLKTKFAIFTNANLPSGSMSSDVELDATYIKPTSRNITIMNDTYHFILYSPFFYKYFFVVI